MIQTQQEFLKTAKIAMRQKYPGLTWDEFAEMAGIEPRAFKTYRMPETSRDYRTMPRLAVRAVEDLVRKARVTKTNR